jgi:hypothetical protein
VESGRMGDHGHVSCPGGVPGSRAGYRRVTPYPWTS